MVNGKSNGNTDEVKTDSDAVNQAADLFATILLQTLLEQGKKEDSEPLHDSDHNKPN